MSKFLRDKWECRTPRSGTNSGRYCSPCGAAAHALAQDEGTATHLWIKLMGGTVWSRITMVIPMSKAPQPCSVTSKGGSRISARTVSGQQRRI